MALRTDTDREHLSRAIELAGPPERLRSSFINGLKHLPVTVTAA